MDQAKLKDDFVLSDKNIIAAGTMISAKKANELFKQTKNRGRFVCPDCGVEVFCAKQKANLDNMKPNEKKPYFKLITGLKKHNERCAFKIDRNANESIHKYKIKSETNYYSKLVEPYPNSSARISESHLIKSSEEQLERKDAYTAGNLDPICDQYLKIINDCKTQRINNKEILTQFKLSLPQRKKTNYYHGFRHVNSRLKSGVSKIYHGEVRYSISCNDGLVLLFQEPRKANHPFWKPVIIIINPDNSLQFEREQFAKLKEEGFLKKNARCFVYGNLEEGRSCFTIRPEYLSWLSLKRKNNATTERIYYQKQYRLCDEVTKSASEFMLKRHYDHWGIDYSFSHSKEEESSPVPDTSEQIINYNETQSIKVHSKVFSPSIPLAYEQEKIEVKPDTKIATNQEGDINLQSAMLSMEQLLNPPVNQKKRSILNRLRDKLFPKRRIQP